MANNRREFIHGAGALAATTAGAALQGGGQALAAPPTTETGAGVPVRALGRTGQKVSMLALGGWHIGAVKDKAEATAIMQRPSTRG